MEVPHSPAVSHHKTVKSPFIAQKLNQEFVVSAARLALDSIVCTHYFLDICRLHKSLKGIEICLTQISPGYILRIEHMSQGFRAAMHGEMFQTCMQLIIFLRTITLKSCHSGTTHHSRQIWILTISLLSSSPSRIAEYIDIRCPHCESMIYVHAFSSTGSVEFDPLLSRCDIEDFLQQHIIPTRRHTYGLREHCSQTVSCRSVQCFIPPVVLADAEFRDCRAFIIDERNLLFE